MIDTIVFLEYNGDIKSCRLVKGRNWLERVRETLCIPSWSEFVVFQKHGDSWTLYDSDAMPDDLSSLRVYTRADKLKPLHTVSCAKDETIGLISGKSSSLNGFIRLPSTVPHSECSSDISSCCTSPSSECCSDLAVINDFDKTWKPSNELARSTQTIKTVDSKSFSTQTGPEKHKSQGTEIIEWWSQDAMCQTGLSRRDVGTETDLDMETCETQTARFAWAETQFRIGEMRQKSDIVVEDFVEEVEFGVVVVDDDRTLAGSPVGTAPPFPVSFKSDDEGYYSNEASGSMENISLKSETSHFLSENDYEVVEWEAEESA